MPQRPIAPAGQVVDLAAGGLYALCNPYALEGPLSTHPRTASGFAPMNCYVLREGEHALLIDTGMSVHEQAILAQLETVLADASPALLPLRGEFNALCNARPIADRFGLRAVYGRGLGAPSGWLDFRPGFTPPGGGLLGVDALPLLPEVGIAVAPDASPRLAVLIPPVRLLPGFWAYDAETRTLFSADMFAWAWRDDASGPWTMGVGDDNTSPEHVRNALLQSRYWWLAGGHTDRLRADLAAIFDANDIVRICPGFGCVLEGSEMVGRQYKILDDLLAELPSEPSIGVSVGRWSQGIHSAA